MRQHRMIDLEKPIAAEAEPAPTPDPSFRLPAFELQSATPLRDAQHYDIDELLCYHDRIFLFQAFQAILKRTPGEAEFNQTLDDLRSGRRTKIEIISGLTSAVSTSSQPVHIAGLKSPAAQRIGAWPVIGYLVRLFAAVARLPRFMRDQQQFEAYSMGKQQEMADYLNAVLLPAYARQADDAAALTNLSVTTSDLVDTVTMLSDSLIQMSARQAELQSAFQAQIETIQRTQANQAQIEIELQSRTTQAQQQTDELRARLEQIRSELEQAQAQAETQKDLQATITGLAASQTKQQQAIEEWQQALEETRRAQGLTAEAHQEFLIQEQRVIVETQKVVLTDLQAQIDDLLVQQKAKHEELASALQQLRGLAATGTDTHPRAAQKKASPGESA